MPEFGDYIAEPECGYNTHHRMLLYFSGKVLEDFFTLGL
jgi:hypothetical protein